MKILNKLTIKHLTLNKKRTIVTIIGIILSTALMVGIGLLFSTFSDYMIKEIISYNGSYHAEFIGINKDEFNKIKSDEYTYIYENKIGFSEFDSQNEYKPYLAILGVNKEYFNELKLIEGTFPKNDSEIVISDHIKSNGGVTYNVGDSITLSYGTRNVDGETILENNEYKDGETLDIIGTKTYKIVGIVERSNYEDYSACGYSVFTLNNDIGNNANLYLTFNKTKNIIDRSEKIASQINYSKDKIIYNDSLLAMYGESRYNNISSMFVSILSIMLALVSIGCIIVIYNSFAISVMERKKQFGLFSSIGATKKQLSHTVFFEAFIVGAIGIILGLFGAFLGIGIVIMIMNNLLKGLLEYNLELTVNLTYIMVPILFMIVVILLSAFIPSRSASRVSPIEAIRQNDDIKIRGKKVKTNKLVGKIFGVEGDLALKNIKRNKKKYRITIVSLFISIVLFISFSAFLDYTTSGAEEMLGTYDTDIMVYKYNENEEFDKLVDELLHSPDINSFTKYTLSTIDLKIDKDMYTDEYKELYKLMYDEELKQVDYDYVNLIKLDDKSYNEYLKELGLNEDKIIIYNTISTVVYNNGNRKNYKVNMLKDNSTIKACDLKDYYVKVEDPEYGSYYTMTKDKSVIESACNNNLNNIYIANKESSLLEVFEGYQGIKVIVNEKIFNYLYNNYNSIDFYPENDNTNALDDYQIAIQSDNFTNLDKIGEKINATDAGHYTNLTTSMQMQKNLLLVIKILMYGFIALVTLIGVTSVFNTINTCIALRRREFSVLRSIGLTKKGFNKILYFESLFFGLKSLLYALPVSLFVVYLIYKSMADVVSNGFMIPWTSIIIAVISVFIIILLSMLYSSSKIKKDNILEQIRDENI